MADAITESKRALPLSPGRLNQTLHGYSEGHRLLESSLQLPDDVARIMLRMSDLSGSNIMPGFEEYLTGYPLDSIGMYALAKTWYAREMPRPGCVWTHTLLLNQVDLALPSLSSLVFAFQRPHRKSGIETYSRCIEWDPSEKPPRLGDESVANLARFIDDFYTVNPSPLLLPAQNSKEFEPMLLAVWFQQWPALRQRFAFCTGALAARRLGTKPFDVQCVPMALVRDVQLEINASKAARQAVIFSSDFEEPKGTSLAAEDCRRPDGGEFRKFLWDVAETDNGRQDYFGFMRIYGLLSAEKEIDRVLSTMAEIFPSRNQALRLKKLLFGGPRERKFFLDVEEASVISLLGSSEHYAAFDEADLGLRDRSEAISHDYLSARRLIGGLFQSPLTPLGIEILAGLLSDLDSQAAREITYEQPQFLCTLVKAKPGLATSASIWKAAGDRKSSLLESIIHDQSLDPDIIRKITFALLESNVDSLIRWALEGWGKPAVFGAMDWVAVNAGSIPDGCRYALTFHEQAVMDWVESEPEKPLHALFSAAEIVAPYSYKLLDRDTKVWDPALGNALESDGEQNSLQFLTFILALALGNAPPRPLGLIGDCFEIVHNAERNRRLHDNAWRVLEPIVPQVFPHYWDKCERMRRGLIASFIKYEWPANELRRRISNPDIFKQLLRSAKSVTGGKAFIKGIRR